MTIFEIINTVIEKGPEIFSTWALIKASVDVIKMAEKSRTHLWTLVITKKGIKVRKILIPKVIPSTGVKRLRLRGRTIGVRLYFSVSIRNIIKAIRVGF